MASQHRILVINPNSSHEITENLRPLITQFPTKMEIHTYTAPSAAPKSINNEKDAEVSAKIVLAHILLLRDANKYDGYLVACYSLHPLVDMLRESLPANIFVLGIFEASISTALALTPIRNPWMTPKVVTKSKFGIVSTGSAWEKILGDSLLVMLGHGITRQQQRKITNIPKAVAKILEEVTSNPTGRFKKVETTGLNADELHEAPREVVVQRMKEATKRLVRINNVTSTDVNETDTEGTDDNGNDATEVDESVPKATAANVVADANGNDATEVNENAPKSTWAKIVAGDDASGKENVGTSRPTSPKGLSGRAKNVAIPQPAVPVQNLPIRTENAAIPQLAGAPKSPVAIRPKIDKNDFVPTDIKVICLGCAGMSGLEEIVREALVEELGEKQAKDIYILDPVRVGIGMLEHMIRSVEPSARL
ncbi:uncharacterized protein PAC_20085 [Phialocephala subalpina]|uniref:DCG1 protein n=1 Tax=Phialocephala subalpina TaxID=576137 RepID=A0A1L7XYU1_9HELO|nr:uncharacterized protein PAC_20085 [Phialocephala subalpina]